MLNPHFAIADIRTDQWLPRNGMRMKEKS